ncbi:uncharacterized protein [Ptychodera flava]|uniref:uncharacterized protein n=1 Tax=Ptychodera flava TaxID=63121 RepID=UPI00396A96F1
MKSTLVKLLLIAFLFNTATADKASDIVSAARGHVGSSRYSFYSFRWPGYRENKCNYFVHDVLKEAGVSPPERQGRFFTGPISAASWYSMSSKPGCNYVGTASSAQPGDVMADGSHVGIAVGDSKTVSAARDSVVENDWGFRRGQSIRAWRCR